MLRYPVKLVRDTNGTVLVDFPDVPEAHTFGEALAAAIRVLGEGVVGTDSGRPMIAGRNQAQRCGVAGAPSGESCAAGGV